MNHREKLVNTITESLAKLELALALIELDKLESLSEQSVGKPQRSVAQILADEAARTGAQKVGDRPTDLRSWTDQLYQNVEQALNRLAIQQEDQPLKAGLGLTKADSTISVNEVGDRRLKQLKKEYEEALVEKYKKQGFVFGEPEVSDRTAAQSNGDRVVAQMAAQSKVDAPAVGDRACNPTNQFNQEWLQFDKEVLLKNWQEMLDQQPLPYAERYDKAAARGMKANGECHPKLDAQSLNNEDCVNDPWDELNDKVNAFDSRVNAKSLEDAIALSKAFDWVIWSRIQPSGLNGDYRSRSLDIRHEGDYYVVYYAGNCYSFPKSCDLTIASQIIKSRIDSEFPRNKYAIQIGY